MFDLENGTLKKRFSVIKVAKCFSGIVELVHRNITSKEPFVDLKYIIFQASDHEKQLEYETLYGAQRKGNKFKIETDVHLFR